MTAVGRYEYLLVLRVYAPAGLQLDLKWIYIGSNLRPD